MARQLNQLWIIGLCLGLLVGCGTAEPAAVPEPTATEITESDTASNAAEPVAEGVRRFVVVTEESTASYIVSEEFFAGALEKLGIDAGIQEITGTTPQVNGELQLRLDDPQNALESAEFTVDISVLETTRSQRDEWIRDNALESNTYPIAQFVATEIQGAPESYTEGEEATFQLLGDLTVREITQPVTFDVTATLNGDTLRGVATTEMQITDFGFDPPSFANTLTVANDFTIRVELTAREG